MGLFGKRSSKRSGGEIRGKLTSATETRKVPLPPRNSRGAAEICNSHRGSVVVHGNSSAREGFRVKRTKEDRKEGRKGEREEKKNKKERGTDKVRRRREEREKSSDVVVALLWCLLDRYDWKKRPKLHDLKLRSPGSLSLVVDAGNICLPVVAADDHAMRVGMVTNGEAKGSEREERRFGRID
ncbi:hypothetical protein L596_027603 [Steinernema carpocapsae]|uniref:Uncharacterized protein n=1 Tax=Steinernema carpocapsae TaxID=34508 RepID=A0A4V5ZXM5_STECR|nr:hypothetical protein L596_027603 [Steinernema carpocapsae]